MRLQQQVEAGLSQLMRVSKDSYQLLHQSPGCGGRDNKKLFIYIASLQVRI